MYDGDKPHPAAQALTIKTFTESWGILNRKRAPAQQPGDPGRPDGPQ